MTYTRRRGLVGAAGFEPGYRPVKSRMLIRVSFAPNNWCIRMVTIHSLRGFNSPLIHLSYRCRRRRTLRSPGFRLPALESGLVAAPAYGFVVSGALTRIRTRYLSMATMELNYQPKLGRAEWNRTTCLPRIRRMPFLTGHDALNWVRRGLEPLSRGHSPT